MSEINIIIVSLSISISNRIRAARRELRILFDLRCNEEIGSCRNAIAQLYIYISNKIKSTNLFETLI